MWTGGVIIVIGVYHVVRARIVGIAQVLPGVLAADTVAIETLVAQVVELHGLLRHVHVALLFGRSYGTCMTELSQFRTKKGCRMCRAAYGPGMGDLRTPFFRETCRLAKARDDR